jgi:hypothetical protein
MAQGCLPSVRDVVKFLYGVPLGVSRENLKKMFIKYYGEKYEKDFRTYVMVYPPQPLTEDDLKDTLKFVSDLRIRHRYLRIQPPELYEKMPSGALFEPIGLIDEASEGNGFLIIYYDKNTNYIGFRGDSSGTDR